MSFNREHVLPQSFGKFLGNFVLHESVCESCNLFFSRDLELPLARDTWEGIERYSQGLSSIEPGRAAGTTLLEATHRGGLHDGAFLEWRAEGDRTVVVAVPQFGFSSSSSGPFEWYRLKDVPSPQAIAVNFVCYRLGSDVALRSEYDALRAFARDGSGYCFDFALPALVSGGGEDVSIPWVEADQHALVLMRTTEAHGNRDVLMIVIGGEYIGRVDLSAPGSSGLPEGTWLMSRFDPAGRAVTDFVLPADMSKAVADLGSVSRTNSSTSTPV